MAASPTHESNPFAQNLDSPAHYDAQKDDFGVQDPSAPVAFHVNSMPARYLYPCPSLVLAAALPRAAPLLSS